MKRTFVTIAMALGCVMGCGHPRTPNQLVDARAAYQQATAHPSAAMAIEGLVEARQSLVAAEHAYREGKIEEAQNLAYVAHRKAIGAQAKADMMRAVETKRFALAEFERTRELQARVARERLERAKGEITIAQQQAEAERQARVAAEEKLSKLETVQSERNDKGLVLTVPGTMLFRGGKGGALLPAAMERLRDIALTLKGDTRTILVVGHTDSRGAGEANDRHSAANAKAVRDYLVTQGIAEERIRSEGMGGSAPVADSESPKGREQNQRVEIIVEEAPGSGHTDKPEAPPPGGGPGPRHRRHR